MKSASDLRAARLAPRRPGGQTRPSFGEEGPAPRCSVVDGDTAPLLSAGLRPRLASHLSPERLQRLHQCGRENASADHEPGRGRVNCHALLPRLAVFPGRLEDSSPGNGSEVLHGLLLPGQACGLLFKDY